MPHFDAPSGADPAVGRQLKRVIVIGTSARTDEREQRDIELDELEELARTLGTEVIERSLISLREPHPATFFRSGVVAAFASHLAELDKPAVLCNDQLTPRQQRNLQEEWGVPVLDRTEVILAIFARRAITAEGRVQVEMAQLEHLLPRLAGGWSHLERQRGGVGLRGGPGEKQIEVDRRLIRQQLKRLRQRLVVIERQRQTRRTARTNVPLASCALVGYTNAGKSTLLNVLTHSEVLADDLLFATLDPTSRRLELPSGKLVILTDTVGFIQKLPTELVEAFAATLEEVRQAHMLCVVVDASHPGCRAAARDRARNAALDGLRAADDPRDQQGRPAHRIRGPRGAPPPRRHRRRVGTRGQRDSRRRPSRAPSAHRRARRGTRPRHQGEPSERGVAGRCAGRGDPGRRGLNQRFSARSMSRCASRFARSSRLSQSFLPRASPISTLTRLRTR